MNCMLPKEKVVALCNVCFMLH